jgi:4-amino-4-deoxy-L-arabinose transferase-like glycosyltransferase
MKSKSSVLLLLWLAVRLAYNGLRELVPDEAYYWVWSRHPAAGYLDHPPMIAWIIRAGTLAFGTSEFAVRSGAAMLTAGTILVTLALAAFRGADPKALKWAALILLLSPFTAVLGTIIAPDTPACFFSICALAAAVAACSDQRCKCWWLVFGLCMGLALLSKYTSILIGGAVGLALISTRQGRREMASIWFWPAWLIAAAIFWPVVIWNQQHDWASFRFQWHHGTAADMPAPSNNAANNLLTYIASQALVFTPVLFVLGIAAMVRQWRRFKSLAVADQMILWAATLPLAFFGLFSLRHRPEANWPVFAYLPMTLILVQWLSDGWKERRLHWGRIGLIVAACALGVAHVPEIIEAVPVRLMSIVPGPWDAMFGWRDYGRALDARSGGAVVFCTSYENAAEASFYMSGRPEVWTIDTNRPTACDYFSGRPDIQSLEKVVCVTRAATNKVPGELGGFPHIQLEQWHTTALGRIVRPRQFIIAQR